MKKATLCICVAVTLLLIAPQAHAQESPFKGNVTTLTDNPGTPLIEFIRGQVAKNGGDAWVGWQITVRPSMRYASIRSLAGRNGYSMVNINSGRQSSGIERVGSERKSILLHFAAGAATPREVLMIDDDPSLRFTVPMVWVKGVTTARSFAAVKSLIDTEGKSTDRGLPMALAAAHDGDETTRYFLTTVRGTGAVQLRKSALFWYAHTLPSGDLGELPKLENELKEKELRKQIAFAYHEVGGAAALARLQQIAVSADEEAAEQAIFWIGQTEDVDVMPILEKLYGNLKSSKLKEKVLFAAHQVDAAKASDFLMRIARTEPDEKLQGKAVFWLGQREDGKSLANLKSLYDTLKSAKVREQVLFAASQIDSTESLEFLVAVAMNDATVELRRKAAFWIGQHDDADMALKMLEKIYAAPGQDRGTREKVLFSVSQVDSPKAIDYLQTAALKDSDLGLREKAIFWLSQCDDESLSLARLRDIYGRLAERSLKEKTLFAVSQVETTEASKFLISVVRTEKDTELRKKALFWLSQRDDSVAADLIGDMINK